MSKYFRPSYLLFSVIFLVASASIASAEQPGIDAVLPNAPQPAQTQAATATTTEDPAAAIAVAKASITTTNCIPFRTNAATDPKALNPDAQPGHSHHHGSWCYYQPLTARQKTVYQLEEPFGPKGIFMPAIAMAVSYPNLANKKGYPPTWTEGAGAFGRNLGDHYARNATARIGELLPAIAFHERVRYTRSTSTSTMTRISHALAGTLVGKSDSGHYMPSFVNFGGAAGSGFVGMAYLPDGFGDITHAGQRSIRRLAGYSSGDLFKEFSPEIVTAMRKLHIPQIPHFPIWWTGNAKRR